MEEEYFYLPIAGTGGIIVTTPQKRLEQAKELIAKYIKPEVKIQKLGIDIKVKEWLPVIIGVCAFILVLRLIK